MKAFHCFNETNFVCCHNSCFLIFVFLFFFFFRLFADILNDASILVEMLSPLFKAYFTFLACLSSISKVCILLQNCCKFKDLIVSALMSVPRLPLYLLH